MIKFNEQQVFFIKELVEEELTELKFKRNRSISVRAFDEMYKERNKFLRDLLESINKQIKQGSR